MSEKAYRILTPLTPRQRHSLTQWCARMTPWGQPRLDGDTLYVGGDFPDNTASCAGPHGARTNVQLDPEPQPFTLTLHIV